MHSFAFLPLVLTITADAMRTLPLHRPGPRPGGAPPAAALLALLLGACTPAFFPSYEIQRFPDLDEKALVLKPGTKEASFIFMLKVKGASNIVNPKGYVNGSVVSAVTADFMENVYLFGDGRYVSRVPLRHDEGAPQVHPFLKVLTGSGTLGVMLVAENLVLGGKRIAQLILIEKGGRTTHLSVPLDDVIAREGGLYDPFVGGEDLDDGLYLCARDKSGRPWSRVYLIRTDGEKVSMEPRPANEAYGCACFEDWMEGVEGRKVFDMIVPSENPLKKEE